MARLDQTRAPFFDALQSYAGLDAVPFSTPGHKRGRGAPEEMRALLPDALALDIPHAGGVDSTHVSRGLLREAELLAAAAYGGDDARFLVNGSTTGNLAMLLAACGDGSPGDEVLVSRMLHKSLLTALIFSGARPVWLAPAFDAARNLPLDTTPATVAAALDAHPRARAVVLVSPSYVGVTSDLAAIARICARASVPLLVDEAWGPHLGFHPDLPPSAMQAGADAGVSSTHKMLAALTQGSTIVARRGRLDLERLHTIVDMVQTTSPSALIFASLDASRRQMALHGRALLDVALAHARRLRDALAAVQGLDVLAPEMVATRDGAGFDPTRVIVDVHGLGLTGYEAEAVLRDGHGVYVEMSDLLSVMLLVTIGDDEASIERAAAGFRALHALRKPPRHDVGARSIGALLFGGAAELTPRQAFLAPARVVPVEQAAGRISAESITPYPPGIPIVAPGERFSPEVIDYLRAGIVEGMYLSGLADPTFATVRVIA
jgi:lysine decarboxylase